MELVEDFESRPHKAVSFVVKGEKEIQAEGAFGLQRRKVAREECQRERQRRRGEEKDSREKHMKVCGYQGERQACTKMVSGEKIGEQEFSHCSESIACSVCKASRKSQRKKKKKKKKKKRGSSRKD